MTKYILHGGMAGFPCESNDRYYQEIINSVPGPLKVLLVYFAVEKERWAELAQWHKDRFAAQAGGKKIEFEVANDNTEEVRHHPQCGWLDEWGSAKRNWPFSPPCC